MPVPVGQEGANATDANASGAQAQDTSATQNPPADSASSNGEQNKGNAEAAMRYQISREREARKALEKQLADLQAKQNEKAPEFNDETDPDGSLEMDWRAEKKAEALLEKKLKEMGIEEKIVELRHEKEQEKFYEIVSQDAAELEKLGISKPSHEEVFSFFKELDEKGITPKQALFLTRMNEITGLAHPKGFTAGEGGKPQAERALTQAEINARMYKEHGACGY